MSPIGLGVFTWGPQEVALFKEVKEIQFCWRKYITGLGSESS